MSGETTAPETVGLSVDALDQAFAIRSLVVIREAVTAPPEDEVKVSSDTALFDDLTRLPVID